MAGKKRGKRLRADRHGGNGGWSVAEKIIKKKAEKADTAEKKDPSREKVDSIYEEVKDKGERRTEL